MSISAIAFFSVSYARCRKVWLVSSGSIRSFGGASGHCIIALAEYIGVCRGHGIAAPFAGGFL